MSDWWLTAAVGRGTWCWQLGNVDDNQRADLITRARALADIPVGDGVHLHGGQPHDQLLSRCVLRDRAELDRVDPTVLSNYRTRMDQAVSTVRRDAARAALLQCTSEERAQVIGEIPPRTTTIGGRVA